MSIVLTERQEEGLRLAVQRYNEGKPWTCIAGYAGTGKSTLIKFIISALGLILRLRFVMLLSPERLLLY